MILRSMASILFTESWCKSYDLDEDATNPKLYQAIITAYCKQGSAWLQNRASSIIAILVMIEELCSLNKKDFDLIIPAIIDMSAVTAVTTEEDKKVKVALTKGGQTLLDFWTKFQDIAFENEEFAKLFRRLKPSHNYWMDFSTGNGSCKIGVSNSLSKGELLYMLAFLTVSCSSLLQHIKMRFLRSLVSLLSGFPLMKYRPLAVRVRQLLFAFV